MDRAQILAEFDRHGILPTSQRIEIAELLFEKPQHLSVGQVVVLLQRKGSGVSKATVYNTLNLFGEHGLVKECVVDRACRFYDSNTEPHHHFYNMDTGELIDIPYEQIQFDGFPEFPDGGQLAGVEVLIKVRGKAPQNLG